MRTLSLGTRLALTGLLLLASGCLYRMEVQQGNMLDNEQVSQLETGMTRSQVLFLLGTPMVPDAFNSDRWDYYHYRDTGRRILQTRRVTVWFKDDLVERFEDDAAAAAPASPAG